MLTDEWQDYEMSFRAEADEPHARVFFDLGTSAVSVEIAEVTLHHQSDFHLASANGVSGSTFVDPIRRRRNLSGELIEPDLPDKYYVDYQFNAMGCRGRDYPIPRSPEGTRILVLGDSLALGAGVHQADTLASQLEGLLNSGSSEVEAQPEFEVINCGVGGYGTRDEAGFYENSAAKYQPDVVLLVMTPDDDESWVEDIKRGEFDHLTKDRNQFISWSEHQEKLFQRSSPDYSESLQAIHDLQHSIQGRGARVAVVLFRNTQDQAWIPLLNQITQGLKDTTVPVLDLGPVLAESQSEEFLTVHENDKHPNEVAHKMAAGSVYAFLQQEGFFVFSDHGKLADR